MHCGGSEDVAPQNCHFPWRDLGRTQCSASEVTTLWRYTNLFIIIFIADSIDPRGKKLEAKNKYHWWLEKQTEFISLVMSCLYSLFAVTFCGEIKLRE